MRLCFLSIKGVRGAWGRKDIDYKREIWRAGCRLCNRMNNALWEQGMLINKRWYIVMQLSSGKYRK